jgi:uncharacterized protein YegP (UPF0339 family)
LSTQWTAVSTAVFVIYPSGLEYRWRLKAGNGEIVAHGESYTTRADAHRAVETIKRIAPTARVEDK